MKLPVILAIISWMIIFKIRIKNPKILGFPLKFRRSSSKSFKLMAVSVGIRASPGMISCKICFCKANHSSVGIFSNKSRVCCTISENKKAKCVVSRSFNLKMNNLYHYYMKLRCWFMQIILELP